MHYLHRSPVCLPQAITCSFCLPFVCPIYCLQSRHRTERPDFSRLLQHLTNSRSLSAPSSQRTRAITAAVVRALRVIWDSLLDGEDALTMWVFLYSGVCEAIFVYLSNVKLSFFTASVLTGETVLFV